MATSEKRKEYLRQWAKNNQDKIKANQERYWKKKTAELQEQSTDKNAVITVEEVRSEYKRKSARKHPDTAKKCQERFWAKKAEELNKENPEIKTPQEAKRAYQNKWTASKKEKIKEIQKNFLEKVLNQN